MLEQDQEHDQMKITSVEVGMFKLPGVVIERPKDWSDEFWREKQAEMDAWSLSDQGTGKRMTETLWSFKKESQRDWFILKWTE